MLPAALLKSFMKGKLKHAGQYSNKPAFGHRPVETTGSEQSFMFMQVSSVHFFMAPMSSGSSPVHAWYMSSPKLKAMAS